MPALAVKKLRIKNIELKEKRKTFSNMKQQWRTSKSTVWSPEVLLTTVKISNAVRVSDIRSLEPKT